MDQAISQNPQTIELTKVFCINGVVVKIPLEDALGRMPYDIMDAAEQPVMRAVLDAQGKTDIHFLTPMTSEMMQMDFPNLEIVENINKTTVNAVAAFHGANPVFGENEDGILR